MAELPERMDAEEYQDWLALLSIEADGGPGEGRGMALDTPEGGRRPFETLANAWKAKRE